MDTNYMNENQHKMSAQEVLHDILTKVKDFGFKLPDIDFDEENVDELISTGIKRSSVVYYGSGLKIEVGNDLETGEPEMKMILRDGDEVEFFNYKFTNSTNMLEVLKHFPFVESIMRNLLSLLIKYLVVIDALEIKYCAYNMNLINIGLKSIETDLDHILRKLNKNDTTV